MPSHNAGAGAQAARLGISGNGVPEAGRARVNEIQRARLLGAMVEVAPQEGFAGASVAHVVARAGVSRRTFYELFEDRESCFLAAFDEQVARASSCLLGGYAPTAGWAERIRTGLIALLRFLDAEPCAARLLVVESLGAGAQVLEHRQRAIAQLIAAVEQGRHETKTGPGLPPLAGEGLVGGALSVIHTRLLQPAGKDLLELAGPLMSMIVLPYLGPAAARRELERPIPKPRATPQQIGGDPLRDLGMRLTHRTVCVLMSVASNPGSSNRELGAAAGVLDQGQISKLLGRLERLGLVQNECPESIKGGPNAWVLTAKGVAVEQVMRANGDHRPGATDATDATGATGARSVR